MARQIEEYQKLESIVLFWKVYHTLLIMLYCTVERVPQAEQAPMILTQGWLMTAGIRTSQ